MTNAREALTSTGKDGWRTPPGILAELDREFRFLLDAAAVPGDEAFPGRPSIGPFASPRGSLGVAWSDWIPDLVPSRFPPAVFVNPPYSKAGGPDGRGVERGIWTWHGKAWQESREGLTVVLLTPPTIDRTWFSDFGVRADELRIFRHRLAFVDPTTGRQVRGNTQGSALTIYRPHVPGGGWPGGPRVSLVECRT